MDPIRSLDDLAPGMAWDLGTLNARDTSAGMIGRGWGHTEADTFDKLSLRGLQMSAALVARLALAIAQDDDFPARHRTQDEVREQLEKEKLLEKAIAAGRFPPPSEQ